ncbi:plasmid maintenance system killer protein [Microbacterium dextranolyticum]|nr:plasmid maintenance system killer protein [Microbacterium dextranolyticum]
MRKLQMLEAAAELHDLRIPPSNRLEKLQGDRAGTYSIRVNDQWRLVFDWDGGEANNVAFIDYH